MHAGAEGNFWVRYKNTVWAALFAIALISTAHYAAKQRVAAQDAALIVATTPRNPQEAKDSDGDGMFDWEEYIHGTNPFTPDERPTSTPSGSDDFSGAADPDTFTDTFSKQLLADYLERAREGELSEDDKYDLITNAVNEAGEQSRDVLFSLGDIETSPDSSAEAVRSYGTTIATILTAEQVPADNELFILQRALQTDTPETLVALDPLITAYEHMIQKTKKVPVPSALINEHLVLLNTLLALHNDIVAMRNIFEDGLPGAVRVKRYPDDVAALSQTLTTLKESLERYGAVYDETDPGFFFAQF